MKISMVRIFAVLIGLVFWQDAGAQENAIRETMIHDNVTLLEVAIQPSIPAALASQYKDFIPTFRDVLKVNTQDQPEDKRLIIRVDAGFKEVGSAKTKRALARVTSFCQKDNREFVGNLILHSYATNGPVDKEEIEQFLRKQILENLACYVPTARAFLPANTNHTPVTIVADAKSPALPETDIKPKSGIGGASSKPLEKPAPEFEIHRNVYLFCTAPDPDIPAELTKQYWDFLPLFRQALTENTRDHDDGNHLIIRVSEGIREVGPTKVKRAQVRITSLIGNSNKEYINDFSLYSYASNDFVNKDEIAQFLRARILQPLECCANAETTTASPNPDR